MLAPCERLVAIQPAKSPVGAERKCRDGSVPAVIGEHSGKHMVVAGLSKSNASQGDIA